MISVSCTYFGLAVLDSGHMFVTIRLQGIRCCSALDSSYTPRFWTRDPNLYISWAAPQFNPNAHVQKSAGEGAPAVGKPGGCNSHIQNSM